MSHRLEHLLLPASRAEPWRSDLAGLGLLVVLGAILLPGWDVASENYPVHVPGLLTYPLVLPALGMLLCMRVGAIDLSVWGASLLGGVVAALGVRAGVAPLASAALAVGAGALCGVASAALTCRARLPSPLATGVTALATGLAIWWLVPSVPSGGSVAVPETSFDAWKAVAALLVSGEGSGPSRRTPPLMLLTRMLTVAAAMVITLATLLFAKGHRRGEAGGERTYRRRLAGALIASGALSAWGGVAWLVEHARAPVSYWPVGDVRVVASALLAGGLLFSGKGRTLLSAVWLAPSMLLASIWQLRTTYLYWGGHELHTLALAGMLAVATGAFRRALSAEAGRRIARLSMTLTVAALGTYAATSHVTPIGWRRGLGRVALGVTAAGALLLVVAWTRRSRSTADGGSADVRK